MTTQNLLINFDDLIFKGPSFNLDKICNDNLIETQDRVEKVKLLLIRDLFRLNWNIEKTRNKLVISPPSYYNKKIIKMSMNVSRQQILEKNNEWIKKHIDLAIIDLFVSVLELISG